MSSNRKSPTHLATEAATAATAALEQIALQAEALSKHERECGLRWAEAHAELKMLSKEQARAASIMAAHAARWEKVAFLLIGTVVCGVLGMFVKSLGWF
jgi:hypothetical protein